MRPLLWWLYSITDAPLTAMQGVEESEFYGLLFERRRRDGQKLFV